MLRVTRTDIILITSLSIEDVHVRPPSGSRMAPDLGMSDISTRPPVGSPFEPFR
jgi:hypothetical protein